MIIDYAIFGDVVTFDTTFCTNKEYRPLGIFLGFNHHRGTVIFGAALLYDETADSFKWLFQTFLQAHGQKHPITIFTDQDAAIGKAIAEVLPNTWHGLCTWHIMQNGIKHLGNLMKDGSCFLTDFQKCMYEYKDEAEFEEAWKSLYIDYEIGNTSWLDRMYGLKHKWARCYMRHTFTLGMRSTQLSESMNSDLKDYLKVSLDVVRFFKHFEQVVNDKRANEVKCEFEAKDKLPRNMKGSKVPILKQASKIYTPYAFENFQDEHNWMGACALKFRNESDQLCEYIVGIVDDDGDFEQSEYKVLFYPVEYLIQCGCMKFETCGILCCHALKILDHFDIKSIPERYILRRWIRSARNIVVEDSKGKEVIADRRLDCTQRYRVLGPKFVRLAAQASNSEEGYELANIAADALAKQLDNLAINDPIAEASTELVDINTTLVLKKKDSQKGGKRLKGWVEKQKKQPKTAKTRRGQESVEMQEPPNIIPETPTIYSETMTWNVPSGSQVMDNSQTFTSLLQGLPPSQTSSATPTFYPHWHPMTQME